jgi:glucose-6-phosphate dehydrogenase assembly protein OpcA
MAATVAPDGILGELYKLWAGLSKPGEEGRTAVLRACTMTLITVAEEGDDFPALGETLAALMPEHPARTIVVRLSGAGTPGLSARVYSQCWMPFGQRRQICCEQVEISASHGELEDVVVLVEPLLAADLPVVVWGRSGRAVMQPAFARLAGIASKVAIDSDALPEPGKGLERLSALCATGTQPADLAWTRLTRWREVLARLFDNREYLARLREITGVRVGYGGEKPPAAALYLGAWAADCLSDAGVRAPVALERTADAPGGGVGFVTLSGDAQGALRITLSARGDVLSTQVDGITQCVRLPRASEYLLLREELGIVREDRVYRKTLPTALQLAISSGTV